MPAEKDGDEGDDDAGDEAVDESLLCTRRFLAKRAAAALVGDEALDAEGELVAVDSALADPK